jgi:hypothetical protein
MKGQGKVQLGQVRPGRWAQHGLGMRSSTAHRARQTRDTVWEPRLSQRGFLKQCACTATAKLAGKKHASPSSRIGLKWNACLSKSACAQSNNACGWSEEQTTVALGTGNPQNLLLTGGRATNTQPVRTAQGAVSSEGANSIRAHQQQGEGAPSPPAC